MDDSVVKNKLSNSKLSEEDKISEYISLLLNDSSFEIKTDEQVKSFSNGKKIGTFFTEHHKEFIDRFFKDERYKSKISTFKARAKIIDYMVSIGGKAIKKVQESYDQVLSYLCNYNNIEDIVRCVSISMSEDAYKKYKSAMEDFMEAYNYDDNSEFNLETYMNNSGMSFAMSAEKVFKSLIIFNECIRSKKYTYAPSSHADIVANNNGEKNLIIGTTKWRQMLNKKGEYGAIRSEASLLDLIKENTPLPTLDKRVFIEELKSTSGHDLFSLYRLLDPISKLIVNSEFYIYDPNNPDNRDKGVGMYAVLTQPIQYDQAGTSDIAQNLEEYSDDFVKARYADIDLNNVKPDELDFLKRIATALKDYCTYKFPIGKKYDSMDFSKMDTEFLNETVVIETANGSYKISKYPFFGKLDKVSKYYLISNFKQEEIDILNEYLKQLQDNGLDYIQVEQFLNLAIFFKQFVVEKLKMELTFEVIVLNNLSKYFDNIKDFDLFNGASNNLFLNNFFTKENVERLQKEIAIIKEKKLSNTEQFISQIKKVDPKEAKIDEFIELLSDEYNTSYKNGQPDSNNIFSQRNLILTKEGTREGDSYGRFWLHNSQLIQKRLIEKYKLLKSKETLTEDEKIELLKLYKAFNAINNHKFCSSVDAKVKVFIDMLGEDKYIGYDENGNPNSQNILSSKAAIPFEGFESINGLTTSRFWQTNAKRIIAKLFIDEEYKGNQFDKARGAVKHFCKKNGIVLPSYTQPVVYSNLISTNSKINTNIYNKDNIKNNLYNNDYIENNMKIIK